MMKKFCALLILILGISSCSNKNYYTIDHLWHYSEDNIAYDITYVENNKDQISFKIEINALDDNQIPLYFKANEYISYVEANELKYDEIRYERYFGEILHSNNDFFIYCHLNEKGKKINYNYIDLKIVSSINTLIISDKMTQIHYIEVDFKK